jgi:hypothetical protein
MPYEYTIDAKRRRVRIRMWGTLSKGEILTLIGDLQRDPRLSAAFSELIDLREASTEQIGGDEVREIAAAALDPASRRAFVVPDSLTYGLARMFGTLREVEGARERIAVFRSPDAAETWLDAGEDRTEGLNDS